MKRGLELKTLRVKDKAEWTPDPQTRAPLKMHSSYAKQCRVSRGVPCAFTLPLQVTKGPGAGTVQRMEVSVQCIEQHNRQPATLAPAGTHQVSKHFGHAGGEQERGACAHQEMQADRSFSDQTMWGCIAERSARKQANKRAGERASKQACQQAGNLSCSCVVGTGCALQNKAQ